MTREGYISVQNNIQKNSLLHNIVVKGNFLLTRLVYVSYPIILIWLFVKNPVQAIKVALIPAVGFLIFSIIRAKINAPRPYEVFDFKPVIEKDTVGKSFPSRHLFSVFVIGTVCLKAFLPIGVLFLLIGVLLGVLRVLGGVHFIKDVVVGALSGIIWGLLMFLM